MNEFQIETAQNVGINQNVANIGERIVAYLIDSIAITLYTVAMILILVSLNLEFGDAWAIYLLISLPAFMYHVLLETFWNGKTLGKALMKIKVVKLDGSKPTFAAYLIRWLLRVVDISLSSGAVAIISILAKGNGQRLGDIAAGTTVISEQKRVSIKDTILQPIPDGYQPTYHQVTMLTDKDMQTIKTLYNNAKRKGNHNIIVSLHHQLIKVMQVEPTEKPIQFVDTVIKDYNYYTQNM